MADGNWLKYYIIRKEVPAWAVVRSPQLFPIYLEETIEYCRLCNTVQIWSFLKSTPVQNFFALQSVTRRRWPNYHLTSSSNNRRYLE